MSKVINFILFVVLVNSSISLYGQQTVHIYFNDSVARQDTTNIFFKKYSLTTKNIKDIHGFENIPNYPHIKLYKCFFDLYQTMFTDYLKGKIPYTYFCKLVKYRGIDTVNLYRGALRNYIYIVSYYDSLYKREGLIIDRNFDLNFGNDPIIYSKDISGKLFRNIKLRGIEFYKKGNVMKPTLLLSPSLHSMSLSVVKNNKPGKHINMTNYGLAIYPFVRSTDVSIGGKDYRFYIMSSYFGLNKAYSKNFYLKYCRLEDTLMIAHTPVLRKGDNIFLTGKKYLIDSLTYDGNELFLTSVEANKMNNNYLTGTSAGTIQGNNIINNTYFTTASLKDRWILLDFWGTWCAPCRKSIPYLKSLNLKFKGKLKIISIACEYNLDKDSVRIFAKNQKMDWIHFYEHIDRKDPNSFEYRFKISTFPTFILINPSHKIIFRGGPENNAQNKIKKLLNYTPSIVNSKK